jgi:alkylation response protein AidB-like acyl-CoA dehydrogenase
MLHYLPVSCVPIIRIDIFHSRQIAFAKMYATRTAQETATDAVQIFGGRGITKTGMGRFIEHYHRTVTFDAILGGAEDVLGDLGVRQAVKKMPKNARL